MSHLKDCKQHKSLRVPDGVKKTLLDEMTALELSLECRARWKFEVILTVASREKLGTLSSEQYELFRGALWRSHRRPNVTTKKMFHAQVVVPIIFAVSILYECKRRRLFG